MKDLFGNECSEVEVFAKKMPWTVRRPTEDGQLSFQLYETKEGAEKAVADFPVLKSGQVRKAYLSSTSIADAAAVLPWYKKGLVQKGEGI